MPFRENDYVAALNFLNLQKEILLYAYRHRTFDQIKNSWGTLRSSISENFEAKLLMGNFQNRGTVLSYLGRYNEAIFYYQQASLIADRFYKALPQSLSISSYFAPEYSPYERDSLMEELGISWEMFKLEQANIINGQNPPMVDAFLEEEDFESAWTVYKVLKDLLFVADSANEVEPEFAFRLKFKNKQYALRILKGLYQNMAKIVKAKDKGVESDTYRLYANAPQVLEGFALEQALIFLNYSVGSTYLLMQKYTYSLQAYLKTWEILSKIENLDYIQFLFPGREFQQTDYLNKIPIYANLISTISNLYIQRNELPKAEAFLTASSQHLEKVLKKELASSPVKTDVVNQPANLFELHALKSKVYLSLNQPEKAKEELEKLGKIANNRPEWMYSYYYHNYSGRYYFYTKQADSALVHFQEAISAAKEKDFPNGVIASLLGKGGAFLQKELTQEAFQCFDSAQKMAETIGLNSATLASGISKGFTLLQAEEPQKALPYFVQGIELIEKGVFSSFQSSRSRELTIENLFNVYLGAVSSAYESHQDSLAFSFVQRAKSRSLTELLLEGSLELSDAPKDLVNRRNNIMVRLRELETSNRREEDSIQQIQRRDSLLQQWEIVEAIFRDSSEAYTVLTDTAFASLEAVQSTLLPAQAYIEFFWAQDIYVFVITKDRKELLKVENSRKIETEIYRLDSLLFDYRNELGNLLRMKKMEREEQAFSQNLYRLLWDPIQKVLARDSVEELIISPDYSLYALPFEMLMEDGNTPQRLIDQYLVSYTQSATSFLQLAAKDEPQAFTKDFMVIGKSDFSQSNEPLPSLSPVDTADFIRYYPNSDFLLEEEASLNQVKRVPYSDYKYVYLSTHASIHPSPELSKLALQDTALFLYQLMDLSMENRGIILSACETGRGRFQRGGGLMGFTRALMLSGTASVIVSQWAVADESTNELFSYYLKNLSEGNPEKQALRKAKLTLRNNSTASYVHPFYWAPFVYYGNN